MSSDFSIELASERILDTRTRKYFEEVFKSYNAESYRSAVVMLWSVVVCDILFKLDQLAKAHGDSTAAAILQEIEQKQKQNPKSPEWEAELLEMIRRRTQLLDDAEYSGLRHLQEHRHLSAHPVITAVAALFSPTRDDVRAHIRTALEAVLTKPPIMTRKVFDAFTEDLEAMAALLPDQASLRRYLEAKYFPHLVAPVETSMFRSLWRLAFKSVDPRCEKNREILYRALCILYERRPGDLRVEIESSRAYYSELHFTGSPLRFALSFLCQYPAVYALLTEAAKTPIKNAVEADINALALAPFLSKDAFEHAERTRKQIVEKGDRLSVETFGALQQASAGTSAYSKVIEIAITCYETSGSFDRADEVFDKMIRPVLKDVTADHVILLLTATESNYETVGRRRALRDHSEVKARIDELNGAGVDLSKYPAFCDSIGFDPVAASPPSVPPPPTAPSA